VAVTREGVFANKVIPRLDKIGRGPADLFFNCNLGAKDEAIIEGPKDSLGSRI
jgi:hypothetical protein